MRVQLRVKHGNAVLWNGSNIDEARAVAGDNFVGMHSDNLLVRHTGGPEVVWVRPGWWIVRWDGAEDVRVFSGGAFTDSLEAEYQETARAQ